MFLRLPLLLPTWVPTSATPSPFVRQPGFAWRASPCRYRDRLAFDGGVTNFIPVPPNCPGAVRVACFPSQNLKAFGNIGLSPDTFEDW